MLGLNLSDILINVPITLVALTGHELAHAYVSTKLGDPTPRMQGRLTLNPLAHLDLMGTILMVITRFGWAKPVMVDPRYYKNRKQGMALTAIAGPIANLIMAFLAVTIFAVIYKVSQRINPGLTYGVYIVGRILVRFAVINLCFMVFNIIPIPPLDGSKVLGIFLPNKVYYTMLQYERYAMILIMVLSLIGVFSIIIGTGVDVIVRGMANILGIDPELILLLIN